MNYGTISGSAEAVVNDVRDSCNTSGWSFQSYHVDDDRRSYGHSAHLLTRDQALRYDGIKSSTHELSAVSIVITPATTSSTTSAGCRSPRPLATLTLPGRYPKVDAWRPRCLHVAGL